MERLAAFAPLFAYPGPDYGQHVRACLEQSTAPDLQRFAEAIGPLSLGERQEQFVRIFDLSPACTLEIGWHLFGEQYERGEFLVELRQHLRSAGIAEQGELPDHLVHVLQLLARMVGEDAEAFIGTKLAPALDKMIGAAPVDNPYGWLLRALRDDAAGLRPRAAAPADAAMGAEAPGAPHV
ncbi:MAG: molecular chaperone TorD family protein [Acidobacteria bacterium]|nr:molecular chaperone TorD family protein [Acidobacteriota bacterium]